jgi:hypothetical protein
MLTAVAESRTANSCGMSSISTHGTSEFGAWLPPAFLQTRALSTPLAGARRNCSH